MKDTLQIGDTFTYTMETTGEMSARRYQESSPPVLATPFLVAAVEAAAARLLEPCLEPGEMSVGGFVELHHTRPTPLGWRVRTVATLMEKEDRRFVFRVECFDEVDKIGDALHTRFVIDAARFMEMVEAKAKAARKGGAS